MRPAKKMPLGEMLAQLAEDAPNAESENPTRVVVRTLLGTVLLFAVEKVDEEGDPDRSELDVDIDEVKAEEEGYSEVQIEIALARRELRDLPKRTSRKRRVELEAALAGLLARRDAPFTGRRRKRYTVLGALQALDGVRYRRGNFTRWRVWEFGRGRWGITHIGSEGQSNEIEPVAQAMIHQFRKWDIPGLEDLAPTWLEHPRFCDPMPTPPTPPRSETRPALKVVR